MFTFLEESVTVGVGLLFGEEAQSFDVKGRDELEIG